MREQLFHERVRECIVSARGLRAGEGARCGGERWEGGWELAALHGTVRIPGGGSTARLWQGSTPGAYRGRSRRGCVCAADSGDRGLDPAEPPSRDPSAGSSSPSCGPLMLGVLGGAGLWRCQSWATPMPASWLCPCHQASSSVSAGRDPTEPLNLGKHRGTQLGLLLLLLPQTEGWG